MIQPGGRAPCQRHPYIIHLPQVSSIHSSGDAVWVCERALLARSHWRFLLPRTLAIEIWTAPSAIPSPGPVIATPCSITSFALHRSKKNLVSHAKIGQFCQPVSVQLARGFILVESVSYRVAGCLNEAQKCVKRRRIRCWREVARTDWEQGASDYVKSSSGCCRWASIALQRSHVLVTLFVWELSCILFEKWVHSVEI